MTDEEMKIVELSQAIERNLAAGRILGLHWNHFIRDNRHYLVVRQSPCRDWPHTETNDTPPEPALLEHHYRDFETVTAVQRKILVAWLEKWSGSAVWAAMTGLNNLGYE